MSDERKAKRKGKRAETIQECLERVYAATSPLKSMYVGPRTAKVLGVKPGWHHPKKG